MNKLMMAVYLALLICPFIAIAITIPFVIFQYKKTKIINVIRCANFYLMIFFTLCAYFMTMLPFPAIKDVEKLKGPFIQLIPFYCFYDFFKNSGLVISDWKTVVPAFSGGIMLGIVFNVLMLVPSGFFLRRLYKFRKREMILVGFLISLIFEFTQLSGLFGIYPNPYRIFDLDDLIQNTFGFFLGGELTHVWRFFKQPSHIEVRQGGEVSFRRRLVADIIDQGILNSIVLLFVYLSKRNIAFFALHPIKSFPLYFELIMILNFILAVITFASNGRTLGMYLMGLRLKDIRGGKAAMWQCATRALVYAIYINLPLLIGFFIKLSMDRHIVVSILCMIISAELVFSYVYFTLMLSLHIVTHGEKLLYEKMSRTHLSLEAETVIRNRQKVLYRGKLLDFNIEVGANEIYELLQNIGLHEEDCRTIELMAEDALLTWMNNGLKGHVFTVQIDKRLSRETLLMCVHGPYVPAESDENSIMKVITGEILPFETYYTGGINVFAVDID
ncbi:MAG: VanZ family protein [Lachnospiraceae bacterium]|nr:VanZ family protein [Lachnospiraceae bacterium]